MQYKSKKRYEKVCFRSGIWQGYKIPVEKFKLFIYSHCTRLVLAFHYPYKLN